MNLLNFGFASFAGSVMLKSSLPISVGVLKVVAIFNLHRALNVCIFHMGLEQRVANCTGSAEQTSRGL